MRAFGVRFDRIYWKRQLHLKHVKLHSWPLTTSQALKPISLQLLQLPKNIRSLLLSMASNSSAKRSFKFPAASAGWLFLRIKSTARKGLAWRFSALTTNCRHSSQEARKSKAAGVAPKISLGLSALQKLFSFCKRPFQTPPLKCKSLETD